MQGLGQMLSGVRNQGNQEVSLGGRVWFSLASSFLFLFLLPVGTIDYSSYPPCPCPCLGSFLCFALLCFRLLDCLAKPLLPSVGARRRQLPLPL